VTVDELKGLTQRDTFVTRLPLGVQLVAFLLIADVMAYWMHRAHHTYERLWRSHAVHHSSTELNWLSSVRVHPFNEVLQNAAIATPLILLGFQPGTVAAYLPFLTFYAIFVHANVRWDFGPLRYVIATPAFHRWHHSAEADAINKNFAGLFPLTDWLFGTLYMPKGVQPSVFGVSDLQVPAGFLGQLTFPVRRRAVTRLEASAAAA
jgi:sterol desaturase/sphingolipid hydroxylase (fatty acid hydroxylase superfamily)